MSADPEAVRKAWLLQCNALYGFGDAEEHIGLIAALLLIAERLDAIRVAVEESHQE